MDSTLRGEAKVLFFRALDDSFRRNRRPYLHEVLERWLDLVDEERKETPAAA